MMTSAKASLVIFSHALPLLFRTHQFLSEVNMNKIRFAFFAIIIICFFIVTPVSAAVPNDSYITGYASALLEHEFKVPNASLLVQNGFIRISAADLTGVNQQALIKSLSAIPGVVQVELLGKGEVLSSTPGEQREPNILRHPNSALQTETTSAEATFLPQGYLFDQLSADPRWPHFSVAYQYYIDDKELGSTGTANFGETFALYRNRAPFGGLWEFGLQAGVFSFFDLAADSKDLVNADYMGGIFASYRYNNFATILRLFHQSSHLGDEFLLRNRVQRINLSYEQIEAKLSYTFFSALRLYGGGGYLFDQDPSDLDPWKVQYGVEFASPWRLAGDAITPIMAGDFQNDDENNWSTNLSLRGGLQFENWKLGQRRLQLLIEYFHGHSPNGQFYSRKIETIGIGAHLRF
jgi:Protein of unknown function (DUF1207)